jgi:hypothetical protein
MSKPKHSLDPWRAGVLLAHDGFEVKAGDRYVASFASGHDAARAMACVNALAGIEDPAAALSAARDALETACYGVYSEPENVKALAGEALALLTPKE